MLLPTWISPRVSTIHFLILDLKILTLKDSKMNQNLVPWWISKCINIEKIGVRK